ncbi:MAG TPA: M48 family metallopeptidase [Gammaproteobacteria bacterium]|nr:M48 family metallopeptidase [Gammaproteobacteria bacterium]
MIRLTAAYYDGRSSVRRKVELVFTEQGRVEIRGEHFDRSYEYPELRISSRLGNTPRHVYLPDGASMEIADNDAIDSAIERLGGYEGNRFLHFLESRYATALAALMVCLGVAFSVIEYGIPLLARHVAFALPPGVEATLGREGLETLDRGLFRPTTLESSTRSKLSELFQMLSSGDDEGPPTRLELRSSPRLGANAFALPSGIVVMTDDLVKLAQEDEELLAVMAHEIGHVHHRHILRQILQNSMTALLVAGLFGDLSSIAGLSATLPTFLVQQKYTREFEREADAFAAEALRARGISVVHLANILKRLSRSQGGSDGGLLDYVSSHPATDERIEILTSRQRTQ